MSLPSFSKIQKKSLTDEVYEHLKLSILSGALTPGMRLLEAHIAEQMQVSRAPVREALRKLEADRLIEFQIGQGAYVRELQPREIWEIYTARSVIEGYVAGLAAERATADDLERLKKVTEKATQAAESGDLTETINADLATHRLIWEISGHKLFYDILTRLDVQIRTFMTIQAPLFANLSDSVIEHQSIYQAILNRDPEAARERIQHHIVEAGMMALNRQPSPTENLTQLEFNDSPQVD